MEISRLLAIVMDRVVHGAAVVPHDYVTFGPVVAVYPVRSGGMLIEVLN